ncbi:MAG: hypothetical protein H6553_07965 [Chitinophagales bacterium]|nr:hypothetical protein [Chitinophagales bacterium]
MSTAELRERLQSRIAMEDDEKILEAIYILLNRDERISIEQYNKEIEASEKEYEKGDYVTQAVFEKEIQKW